MGPVNADFSRKRVRSALIGLVLMGAALRVGAALFDRPLIPDEYFQYLEPAWWHLTGAGIAAWEWHEGLRSWVLPFFNGAWMALGMALGVRDGAWLTTLVRLQWALINTGLVLVAWRGGSSLARALRREPAPASEDAGFEGGLLAAALCAGFGPLVVYGGHALSELPSMLCLVAGLVSCAELCERPRDDRSARSLRKAAWAGALLSLGACLRIANGPLTLLAPLWLLCTRRFRALLVLLGAALVPALLFGLIDLFTWGTFAGSFANYVKFNFIQGGAARFGTEGATFYLERLWETLPFGLPLLALAALGSVRASWPYLVSALALVGYLSREPHKEARFVLAFWPYLLIAAGGGLGVLIARARAGERSFARGALLAWLAALAVTLVVLVDGTRNTHRDHWLDRDRVAAHAWLGHQADITGVMIDWPIGIAGSMALSSPAPQLKFDPGLLGNPLISHVVARAGMLEAQLSLAAGFEVVHQENVFVVLRRR
jgi:phosphatidylinositol glycan class B